jgi:DNA repair protein RadC
MANDNPHANHRARVRKRYRSHGLGAFADHEILELLLFYCYPRCDTNKIAHRMVKAFGSLSNLMDADVTDIMSRCGVSENVAVLVSMVPQLAGIYLKSKWDNKTRLDNAKTAGEYATSLFVDATTEMFFLICLNTNKQINHVSLIATGTVDETAVYTRDIVNEALRHKAVSVILTHNHPGGSLRPSRQDMEVTRTIIEGLQFINIQTIDHIIVAGEGYYSFAARRQFVDGY